MKTHKENGHFEINEGETMVFYKQTTAGHNYRRVVCVDVLGHGVTETGREYTLFKVAE